jgi:DNA replication protein DnaC
MLSLLLREYDRKRIKAENEAEERKKQIYEKIPKLEKIDTELNRYAINTAKEILKNDKHSLENFNERVKELKAEKIKILANYDLTEQYLKPKYDCQKCNDTGYITDENMQMTMCNCLKQKLIDLSYNKSNIANLKTENFETFNSNLYSNEVNLAKFKVNVSPRKNIMYIKQKCEEFVENFDNPESKNLLFVGNTGLRKNIYVKLHCK